MIQADVHYPAVSVRALLDTGLVTAPTAAALRARLDPVKPPDLLDGAGAALLAAICDRLIPQPDRAEPIDIAARLQAQIAGGSGDGWRYADLPGDAAALVAGIAAVDAAALQMHGSAFVALDGAKQGTVLGAVQRGDPSAASPGIDSRRWFEELLVAATEIYFSHPLASEEIGYLGMADALGWSDVGLGARAPFEPVAQVTP